MDIFLLVLVCIGAIVASIYVMIITPYKQGYKGLSGLIEYGKKQSKEAKEQNALMEEQMLAEYDELKVQFIQYSKMVFDIDPTAYPSDYFETDFEKEWKNATFHRNLNKRVGYARKAVSDIKSAYEYMAKTKAEYFENVNNVFDDRGIDSIGMNDIKEKFTKYYSYDDSAYESYIQAMKQIINDIERKQKLYEVAQKRGIESVPLSFAEEVLLPDFKKTIAEYERQKEEQRRIERENAMLAQLEELQRGQKQQMEQFAKAMSKK